MMQQESGYLEKKWRQMQRIFPYTKQSLYKWIPLYCQQLQLKNTQLVEEKTQQLLKKFESDWTALSHLPQAVVMGAISVVLATHLLKRKPKPNEFKRWALISQTGHRGLLKVHQSIMTYLYEAAIQKIHFKDLQQKQIYEYGTDVFVDCLS